MSIEKNTKIILTASETPMTVECGDNTTRSDIQGTAIIHNLGKCEIYLDGRIIKLFMGYLETNVRLILTGSKIIDQTMNLRDHHGQLSRLNLTLSDYHGRLKLQEQLLNDVNSHSVTRKDFLITYVPLLIIVALAIIFFAIINKMYVFSPQ